MPSPPTTTDILNDAFREMRIADLLKRIPRSIYAELSESERDTMHKMLFPGQYLTKLHQKMF